MSPNCPRCGSSNTKFCYYNNYSLTQPRYFCKGCRRYWTKGGSLRNIPVGGGCRKNRRGKSVRLSTDDHHHHYHNNNAVPSKGFAYGIANEAISSHSSGSEINSNTSSPGSSGSHIDLALVYANFLNNQQPDSSKANNSCAFESIIQEFPGEFDPSLEFCTNLDATTTNNNRVQMIPAAEDQNCNNNDQIYYNSVFQDQSILPPLPSTEDQMWLNSQIMVNLNHNHQSLEATTPEPLIGPGIHHHHQAVQDPNLLFGNWSPFDFSSDDTFTKT
ncbi:hypothetical protein Pint_36159 [Pistacia integerrima]|uniref:Uncharacterized protein n=1 Tax=Pistacia integerrima TaxID=434235 RepID=A0ACC0Y207_9ROSI|nr:hypothetical protein Pint_36159 [Pistacia integerrima]